MSAAVRFERLRVRAPGRVNLIGDHTDYTDGLCFPMAIDRRIEIVGQRQRDVEHEVTATVRLTTAGGAPAVVPLDVADVRRVEPEWARYVAGVVAELRPSHGFSGEVSTTLPPGAGLSSSAALEVAVALALGADGDDVVGLARLCQAAEHAARGLPTGLLDQLAVIGGVAGHGLLLDCRSVTLEPVPLPPAAEVSWLVVFTGARSLGASQYATRVEELARAAESVGPIRDADETGVASLADSVLRARARHVVTENARVAAFAAAMRSGDLSAAGRLMNDSHRSLSTDFESSTAQIDALCDDLAGRPGVLGARITGGGWGGCVVALARPGAVDPSEFEQAWLVHPAAGASVAAA